MTSKDEIIAQVFTLYYQWACPDGLRTDTGASTLVRLFKLLQELDEKAASKVFAAAVEKRDFPDDVGAQYPPPVWPRSFTP